jgi:hypothetical protein
MLDGSRINRLYHSEHPATAADAYRGGRGDLPSSLVKEVVFTWDFDPDRGLRVMQKR